MRELELWLVGARDQVAAPALSHPRGGAPCKDHLELVLHRYSSYLPECQPFRESGHVGTHDQVVYQLHAGARAHLSHVRDILSHRCEDGFELLEGLLIAADHDVQLSGRSHRRATCDRRIEHPVAKLTKGLGDTRGGDCADGPHVYYRGSRGEPLDDALVAEENLMDGLGVGHHQDGRPGVGGGIRGRVGSAGTGLHQGVHPLGPPVPYGKLVSGLEQISGHRSAHRAYSYESKLHLFSRLLQFWLVLSATAYLT